MTAAQFIADFRAFILATAGVSEVVGENMTQNKLPQARGIGIAFRRGSSDNDETRCLAGDIGGETQYEESIDVEAIGESSEAVDDLAGLLKTRDGFFGPFGTGRVQAVFVRDHTDQYSPIGAGTDDARHRAALEFEISGYTPGS